MGTRLSAAVVLILGLAAPAVADESRAATSTLTLEMTGFRNDKGTVKIALWRTRDGFPRDERKAARRYLATIVNGTAKIVAEGLEPGDWAIAAFHDENDNGKVDTNFLGIPKEGLGVSRDAKGAFGPPSFEAAKLPIGAGASTISFKIYYYLY